MIDAIVVGAGPNGLAAAVTMARAGLTVEVYEAQATIGGGARTAQLGLAPGITHDLCSAVHPLALASPFFREFDLPARGVELIAPKISYAHPLDGGRAGLAYRSLARTVDELGVDGRAWMRLFGPLIRNRELITGLAMSGIQSARHPGRTARGLVAGAGLGVRAVRQAVTQLVPAFDTDRAAALFAGVAAHSTSRLPGLVPSVIALMLGMMAHSEGWPIPVGGSQKITDALVADFEAHGGRVFVQHAIEVAADLPPARVYLFDTTPEHVAQVYAGRLPAKSRQKINTVRRTAAVAKVDFVLNGPVPWQVPAIGEAATVHLGGSQAEIFAAEAAVTRGRHAAAPVVLVSDPTVADPGRELSGVRPLWAYAHVPVGSPRDVTGEVIGQIERFAPGFTDTIIASTCTPASERAQTNANYIGGDIAGGQLSLRRLLVGVPFGASPYATPIAGTYLCSAATPPGPGVHGMSGWHAATEVLRTEFNLDAPPLTPTAPLEAAAGTTEK